MKKVARAKRIAELAQSQEELSEALRELDGGKEFRVTRLRWGGSRNPSVDAFDHLTEEDTDAINKYIATKLRARSRAMVAEIESL